MLALNNIRGKDAFLQLHYYFTKNKGAAKNEVLNFISSQLLKFGSSRFFVGWGTDRRNRKIANQGKEEVIITVTVADSFSDLDLVVEAFELAGADWVDGMSR